MSKPDDTAPEPDTQLATRFDYDVPSIRNFLNIVFHTEFAADEHIMMWAVRGTPGYPSDADSMLDRLPRMTEPRALYFGTSTGTPNPDDGKLYNRQTLCKRTHVIVLDDIGTKVSLDDFPDLMEPTYIIETSQDNFQYGYVLDEPLEDIHAAKLLVQLLYDAGVSDGGGAMANKLVRLPDGVNGKPGRKGKFPVRLAELHNGQDNRWTPAELLAAAGLTVTWAEVLAKGAKVRQVPKAKNISPWSTVAVQSPNLNGSVDPVLEWLYQQEMVKQETGDWVEILCPWADMHTSPGDTAGYSPLGRGIDNNELRRGFHCFHEHCKERRTGDFLAHVEGMGGPSAPVSDPSTELHLHWTLDPITELAHPVNVATVPNGIGIRLPMLKRMYPKMVLVPTAEKTKLRSIVDVWATAPHRILTYGAMPHPAAATDLCSISDRLVHNTFKQPNWPAKSERYSADITRFCNFIEYLIPDDAERGMFLDWLGMKVRDQSFRGPAMLMMTSVQGTGRTTLGAMVSTLVGASNAVTLTYDQLTGGGAFNDWQLHTMAICNEVFESRSGGNAAVFYKGYERLKSLIEFQPTMTAVNIKNTPMRSYPVFTSYLMFSNHMDALPLDASDRRIYAISNTQKPESPAYFTALNEWLTERPGDFSSLPYWAGNVYHWLCGREVDITTLMAPVVMNATKQTMIQNAQSSLDHILELVLETWSGPFISTCAIDQIVNAGPVPLSIHMGQMSPHALRAQISYALNRVAFKPLKPQSQRLRVGGAWGTRQHTLAVLRTAQSDYHDACMAGAVPTAEAAKFIGSNDPGDIAAYVLDAL